MRVMHFGWDILIVTYPVNMAKPFLPPSPPLSSPPLALFFPFFLVLGLELRAYTLSHPSSPFCDGYFQDGGLRN
jgi:hypothetical protein